MTVISKHIINIRKRINQVIIMICVIIQPGMTLCCRCNEGSAESWSCESAEQAASCWHTSLIPSACFITPSWTGAPAEIAIWNHAGEGNPALLNLLLLFTIKFSHVEVMWSVIPLQRCITFQFCPIYSCYVSNTEQSMVWTWEIVRVFLLITVV